MTDTTLPEATGTGDQGNATSETAPCTEAFVVHTPSFWPDTIPTDRDSQKQLQIKLESEYESKDWLPEQLLEEIKSCFPSDADIDQHNQGQRCPQAFSKTISEFFQVGRIFLNYKQLVAAGQVLLDAWAVSSSHAAKSLSCYYSSPLGRKKPRSPPQRQQVTSPKELCCPFRIRYSFVKKTRDLPNVFLRVKVTFVDTRHNHSLGDPEHWVAKAKSGTCKPNPKAWALFLQAFRQNPQMNADSIRQLLKDAYPLYKSFTAKDVSNIRRGAISALRNPKNTANVDDTPRTLPDATAQGTMTRARIHTNNSATAPTQDQSDDDFSFGPNDDHDNDDDDTIETMCESNNLTSHSLMLACHKLCDLIQHDKKRMQEACIVFETMIQRCRDNLDLVAVFGSSECDVTRNGNPRPTPRHPQAMITTGNVPAIGNGKRRKSSIEQRPTKRKPPPNASTRLDTSASSRQAMDSEDSDN